MADTVVKTQELRPALISSFNPQYSLASPRLTELSDSEFFEQAWPKGRLIDADLYLLMEKDVDEWSKVFRFKSAPRTAYEFLALISRDSEPHRYWTQIAEMVCNNAKRGGASIVAITSFFPEINAAPESPRVADSIGLLTSLMGIAIEISRVQKNERVPTIQSVTGSVISSFERYSDPKLDRDGRKTMHARRLDDMRLIRFLLTNIGTAIKRIQEHYDSAIVSKLRVPLELEPGPLYLLRDPQSLDAFDAEITASSKEIADCVGFNLDVPHWWLAEKTMSQSFTSESTKKLATNKENWTVSERLKARIFHAHISGHSERGHFGDFSLSRLSSNQQSHFKKLLQEIKRLPNCNYVSLEFEAAKSMPDVEDSVATLLTWLG